MSFLEAVVQGEAIESDDGSDVDFEAYKKTSNVSVST